MYFADDVTVVIPTRDRWEILARTLAGLRHQTAPGFRTMVVVDGTDQTVPDLGEVEVVVTTHGGPGVARNVAADKTDTQLVLFLGDDMVPDPGLVAAHLAAHNADPAPEAGVLGFVVWHDDVPSTRLRRWLDWSATLFDFGNVQPGEDAHWARFYSCNVSLKRQFFLDADGFDEEFRYYYEDLDLAWRLGERGLRLRFRPDAVARHLHRYDWGRLVQRFDGIALGEHRMAQKHEDFVPFFRQRAAQAVDGRPVLPLWPVLADRLRPSSRFRPPAERKATRWYYRRLGGRYLAQYRAAEELSELRDYLGDDFDHLKLWGHARCVEAEARAAPSEEAFYRSSSLYLYDLTVFAMSGTKDPYLRELRSLVRPGARLLDFGCGIGSDGLRLLDDGYRVEFADFDNPSTRYLRWRLARRGHGAPVHDVDGEVPSGFDAAYCFDVVEHVPDPVALLTSLEARAPLVIANFVEPLPDDTELHHAIDVGALLRHAERRGIVRYRRFHGRSHLVAYRGQRPGPGRGRSRTLRHIGAARSSAADAGRRASQRLTEAVAGVG